MQLRNFKQLASLALIALMLSLSACSGGAKPLITTANSKTDIGGLDGVLLGSYDTDLKTPEQWTKRELGHTISYKKDYTLTLDDTTYSGEMKLTYRNGPLVSAAVTFMLMDKPADEVAAVYDALEKSLRSEYSPDMFREPSKDTAASAGSAGESSGSENSSRSLEVTDEQQDLIQLLSSGGLVDLSVQSPET